MPNINETKVYQLGEAILAQVHNTDIIEFINVTMPRLIKS